MQDKIDLPIRTQYCPKRPEDTPVKDGKSTAQWIGFKDKTPQINMNNDLCNFEANLF